MKRRHASFDLDDLDDLEHWRTIAIDRIKEGYSTEEGGHFITACSILIHLTTADSGCSLLFPNWLNWTGRPKNPCLLPLIRPLLLISLLIPKVYD